MTSATARAAHFIDTNARLLDRLRFAFHFTGGSAAAVRTALLPYANPDGGFGNALEADLRGADSQPVPVEAALHVLHEIGSIGDPLAVAAAGYLQTITTPAGGVPWVLSSARDTACAPWWQEGASVDDPPASLNPTASIVGLLYALRVEHPWRAPAEEFCWQQLKALAGKEIESYVGHAILTFLEHHPDRDRALATLTELRDGLLSGVTYDPDAPGHIHRPIDFAPESGTLAAGLFDAGTLDRHLDVLQAAQQSDGGWEIDFPAWCPASGPEWRGSFTLGRLLTLRSYGRL